MTPGVDKIGRLERLATWLDSRFLIPGTGWAIGFDSLIGLIPGIGDGASALVSLYIISQARDLGVRKRTLTKMAGNALVDFILGTIPLVGDLFDIGFKANLRNVALIRADLEGRDRIVPRQS